MPRIEASTLAEHKEAVWKRLRESFLAAMAEEGYGALSLASVARRAGIARNSIYYYAPTKDALLAAVVRAEIAPFVAQLIQEAAGVVDPEERLAFVVRRQMAEFAPDARGIQSISTLGDVLPQEVQGEIAATFAPLGDFIGRLVEQGISTGIFRPVANVQRVVEMMIGVVVAARRLIATGTPSEVIAAETLDFLLGALRIPGGSGAAQSAVRSSRARRKG